MSSGNFSLGPYVQVKMPNENFSLGPYVQMKIFQLTNPEDLVPTIPKAYPKAKGRISFSN